VSDGRFVRLGILLAYTALLALAAVVTFEVIERPARNWMRRALARTPAATTAHEPALAAAVVEEPVGRPAGRL
jgi:peptidoglycan/LPS O-acetylase OafA/YrhL